MHFCLLRCLVVMESLDQFKDLCGTMLNPPFRTSQMRRSQSLKLAWADLCVSFDQIRLQASDGWNINIPLFSSLRSPPIKTYLKIRHGLYLKNSFWFQIKLSNPNKKGNIQKSCLCFLSWITLRRYFHIIEFTKTEKVCLLLSSILFLSLLMFICLFLWWNFSESLIKSLLYFISKVHETLGKLLSCGTINWSGKF